MTPPKSLHTSSFTKKLEFYSFLLKLDKINPVKGAF